MRKFLIKSIAILGIVCTTSPLVACANKEFDKTSLALYQALLWQISAERKAGLLTQFAQATRQFYDVMEHPKNKQFLDYKSVKAIFDDKLNDYKVQYKKPQTGKYIPAVMVDIDETLMDNTLYWVFLALKNKTFAVDTWYKWVDAQKSPIYDGVLDFVKTVWENGAMILFGSNRPQGDIVGNPAGDQLIPTRKNLLKYGYPSAFLKSHLWWMSRAIQNEDKKRTNEALAKMNTKEKRYNYINNINTTLSAKSSQELGIKINDEIPDFVDNSFKNMPVQIIMRVGDDINDFNDNFTKNQTREVKHAYVNDPNIRNLFGKVGPRISFENKGSEIIKNYYEENLKIHQNKYIKKTNYHPLKFNPYETYTLITGNSMYGGWTNKLANNMTMIKKSLHDYWKHNGGDNIFT